MNIIQQLESELGKPADALPKINVGDDVEVDYLIREGDKERIQTFKGLVLAVQAVASTNSAEPASFLTNGPRMLPYRPMHTAGANVWTNLPQIGPIARDFETRRVERYRHASGRYGVQSLEYTLYVQCAANTVE